MTYSDSSSMSVALNVPNKVFGPMGTGVAGDPGGLPLLLDTGSNQTVTSAGGISGQRISPPRNSRMVRLSRSVMRRRPWTQFRPS